MKIKTSILFFLALGLLIFIFRYLGFSQYIHPKIWLIYAFFLAIAFLNYQLMKGAFENNREKFITYFMASVVVRLILSLLFLGTFVFTKVENLQLFAINFFVLYLCALVFEIFENSRNLQRF